MGTEKNVFSGFLIRIQKSIKTPKIHARKVGTKKKVQKLNYQNPRSDRTKAKKVMLDCLKQIFTTTEHNQESNFFVFCENLTLPNSRKPTAQFRVNQFPKKKKLKNANGAKTAENVSFKIPSCVQRAIKRPHTISGTWRTGIW